MKLCANCNNELNGEMFCPRCGAADMSYKTATSAPTSKKKYGRLVVILLILVLGTLLLFSPRSCQELVQDYGSALVQADAKQMLTLMPDKVVDQALENYGGDKKRLQKSLERILGLTTSSMDAIGIDKKALSFKLVEETDLSKEELTALKQQYESIGLNIRDAKKLDIEMRYNPRNGEKQTRAQSMNAVKVGRSWYLLDIF